jgi:enoyl-CoA hydratase
MSNPGKLNAPDRHDHAELADIWGDVDVGPNVSSVLLRGEGGNYSAGGELNLIDEMVADWDTRVRGGRRATSPIM